MNEKFRALRKKTGMSQNDYSRVLNIPLGTYRNWEQGLSLPPEYVYNLVEYYITHEILK